MPFRRASRLLHEWALTPSAARAIQQQLRHAVVTCDALDAIDHVAGVDVGFEDDGRTTRAAFVLLSFPDLVQVDAAVARLPTAFAYVPGLLSFRELPAVLAALDQLRITPDVLLCDGHGLAHPRRFGIACHLGVLTDTPAIGVGKSRLVGTHGALAEPRGATVPLCDGGETIGVLLRTRARVKPVYVSIGHRVSLETAVELVLRCTPRYRLPETTRRAHHLASNPGSFLRYGCPL